MKSAPIASVLLVGVLALTNSLTSFAEEGLLSDDEIRHLYFMREEEKLARVADSYEAQYIDQEWVDEILGEAVEGGGAL
jgi:hypothetical protein